MIFWQKLLNLDCCKISKLVINYITCIKIIIFYVHDTNIIQWTFKMLDFDIRNFFYDYQNYQI